MDKEFLSIGVKVLRNVFLWAFFNTFFGLVPLFFILSGQLFEIEVEYKDIIKEGIVAFFCIAIVGAVWVDYQISSVAYNKLSSAIINVMPFVFIGVVYVMFKECRKPNPTKHLIEMFEDVQVYLVGVSTIYCLMVKSAILLDEERGIT